VYKGNRYEAPGDDLSRLDGMIKAFVEDSGYPEGSYENMSYAYDGSSYTDDYGIEYRNFKVSFDAYGNRYRFSYAGSVEIESTASTETATEEAATEETATEETASEKKLTKNIEGGVDEAVPGNRIDAEAEQESPEELGDASAAESDENSEGSGENVRTDIQDNLGTRFVIITLVIVLLGAAVTGLALYRRRRTVTE
jgi:hypothetical protein